MSFKSDLFILKNGSVPFSTIFLFIYLNYDGPIMVNKPKIN